MGRASGSPGDGAGERPGCPEPQIHGERKLFQEVRPRAQNEEELGGHTPQDQLSYIFYRPSLVSIKNMDLRSLTRMQHI